jgi:transglutaminase-like putative cysteine protease
VFVLLNNKIGMYIGALAVVVLLSVIALILLRPEGVINSVEKTLRFTYTLKNTSNELIETADFIAMIPAEIKGSQHVVSINSTEQYELLNTNPLNQSIKFTLRDLPPYGTKVISITLVMEVSSIAKNSINKKNQYLQAEKYIEKDSHAVKNIALLLDKKTSAIYAKSAFEWAMHNIQDAGYVIDNKGAQYAIEKKLGDCTEYMYAFVALARANDIPARAMAGFVVPQSASILNASDYHNWAEFYDSGRWVIADPQKRIFDQQYENYIITRVVSGAQELDISTNRFLITDKRLSVSL